MGSVVKVLFTFGVIGTCHIKLDVSRTNPICEPKSEHQVNPLYPHTHTHTHTHNRLLNSMPNNATSVENPFWWRGNIIMFTNEDAQKYIYAIISCNKFMFS